MAEKVRDLELDKFVEMVLENDEKVASQVQESGVDATKVIGKYKSVIDKYGISTGVGFATARLKEAILEANSESVKGLLVGQRDRFGTNAPIRIPVLSSTGDHMEVTLWGTTVKLDDSKVEVPYPCIANLRIVYGKEYKGIPSISLISAEKFENLSIPDTVLRLGKVAKSVGELDGGDELHPVVVRGRISFVKAATRWKNKEKDGEWQIYLPNQHEPAAMHPVMQISLETDNGNSVRVVFDRQHNAVPTIMMEDFINLCEDAVKASTDPGEQAKFFGECMRGREVIVVGFVTKFAQQQEINYIDMSGYAIFDAKVGKQATLSKAEKTEDASDEGEVEKPAVKAKSTPKTTSKKGAGAKGVTFDELKDKAHKYCEALGITANDLTVENLTQMAPGKSKGFIEEVLTELKSEA
jgi:hypothetical protein